MLDPDKYIRKAFGDCLAGHVIIGGKVVSVVDTFSDDFNGKHQILLGTLEGISQNDKESFNRDVTLTIDIATRTDGSASRQLADDIAEQVALLVQPDRKSTGLQIDGRFQIINLRQSSSGYLTEKNAKHFVVRKLLRYQFRIVQI